MGDIIRFIFDAIPFLIGGFVVYVVMSIKHNEEIRKLTLEAYYKGKEDMENIMLREQLEKANGNKNKHDD